MNVKRRNGEKELAFTMKRELNEDQRDTLSRIEMFGWELKFIRHPLFQPPVAVLFDSDRRRFAVLEQDGRINDTPDFVIQN